LIQAFRSPPEAIMRECEPEPGKKTSNRNSQQDHRFVVWFARCGLATPAHNHLDAHLFAALPKIS
jgi:hypothetical protein